MLKKLLIISSTLLLITIIAFGAYSFFSGGPETVVVDDNGEDIKETDEGGEDQASDKIIALSREPVLGATLTYDGNAIKYYHRDTGNVYQMLLDGASKKTISTAVLKNLIDVKWSPAKDNVITVYKDEGLPHKKKFVYFDFETKKAYALDDKISDVIWLPAGNQIAYHFIDKQKNVGNLATSLPDGRGWKKIMDLNISEIILKQIPGQSKISFSLEPSAYRESPLQVISTLGGNPAIVSTDKFGLDAKWSPDGKKAVISSTKKVAGNSVVLSVINDAGDELGDLGIATVVDKVVWSDDGEYLYYASPESIPENAAMPDDYLDKKIRTSDTFWRVSVTTKQKEQLTFKNESTVTYDAINLFLSPKEDQIFFVNRDDDKLYTVKL